MILKSTKLVAPLRLLTLILGALITLLMTKLLINIFGVDGYAKYVVITAIPSLIPFADLGLGLSVFNVYSKQDSDVSITHEAKEKISLSFYLICIFACFAFISIFLFSHVQIFERLLNKNIGYLQSNDALLILGITFFSTPLTLGFRKMYANGNVLKAILLSFLIPLLNLLITLLLIPHSQRTDQWIIFAPSMSYLIANLIAFFNAKVHRDLVPLSFYHFKSKSYSLLRFASYATLFSSLIAVMLQFPKFYFAQQNAQINVAKYAILLLISSSVGSLVSAHASVFVPTFKKYRFALWGYRFLLPTKKLTIITLAIGLIGFIYGRIFIYGFFKIEFSWFEFFVSEIAIFIYLLWVFYNSFLTELSDLKFLFGTGILSSFSQIFLLYSTGAHSFSVCITMLFLLFFTILLILSIFRIFTTQEIENE